MPIVQEWIHKGKFLGYKISDGSHTSYYKTSDQTKNHIKQLLRHFESKNTFNLHRYEKLQREVKGLT